MTIRANNLNKKSTKRQGIILDLLFSIEDRLVGLHDNDPEALDALEKEILRASEKLATP